MSKKLSHVYCPKKIPRYTGPSTSSSTIATLIFLDTKYTKQEVKELIKDGKVYVQISKGNRKLRDGEELYIEEEDCSNKKLIDI